MASRTATPSRRPASGWRRRVSITAFTITAPTVWSPEQLDLWLAKLGWEALLNTRGTTFRAPAGSRKTGARHRQGRDPLLAHLAMIKRPLLDQDGTLTLGFKADLYQSLFSR